MAEQFRNKQGEFPITEAACKSTISLPFYNNLAREEVATVCRELRLALDNV
jgi:dTDP-4-amino-4,6-dideoxygalactose transaminase